MAGPILQLKADELASAFDGVDLDVLAEQFVGRAAADRTGQTTEDAYLTPWRGRVLAVRRPMTEPLLFEDRRTGARCVLPAPSLRACRAAALTGLAARTLLTPGVVTAAVLGGGPAMPLHLTVIARCVPGVGNLLVCPAGVAEGEIAPRVLDQLDLARIRLAVAATVGDAASAADLVVVVAATSERLDIGAISRGAVLVNATNHDLPDDLIDCVDRLVVDDAALLEEHLTRYFVRAHLEGRRRIDADLCQVLTGTRPGRTQPDQILLVELLSADALDPSLAGVLRGAALDRGLGGELFE